MSTGSTVTSGVTLFVRRVAGTLGVRLAITAMGVISGVIVARWLGSGAVGIIASLNVMVLLAITVGNFGLPSAITFLVARDRASSRRVLTAAIGFGLAIGSLVAAVIVIAVWLRPTLMGEVPFTLVLIACAALPFQMVSYLCLAVYLGLERMRPYNLLDLAMQAMTLIGALVFIVTLGKGVPEIVAFGAVANIAISALIIVLSHSAASVSAKGEEPVLREMLRYGSRFFVALAAGIVILRGDLLVVNYFRTSEEAGVYAIATQASIFLHMMPNVISTILFPRSAGVRDESGELTCRVTRHSVVLLFLLCAAAVPCAFLLPVIYGNSFSELPAMFLILLPGVFLLGLETIQVQHFTGLGLPRRIPVYWLVTLLISIGLNLMLVPLYGAWAAAAVSTASYVLIFLLVAQFFRSRTGRSYREAFVLTGSELRSLFDRSFWRSAESGR